MMSDCQMFLFGSYFRGSYFRDLFVEARIATYNMNDMQKRESSCTLQ